MARKPMMAGNWKMNKTVPQAVVLTQEICNRYEKKEWPDLVEVVLCTPSINIGRAKAVIEFERMDIKVAAQNVYFEESGAYTGEVSAEMLLSAGCDYSIVGHSERRELFYETDEQINKKIKALLKHGLGAIVCVGESREIRDKGTQNDYICAQLEAAFAGLSAEEISKCVVAYEPIWAIGTGLTASPEQADAACAALRDCVLRLTNEDCAEGIRILYGGSMNTGNVESLIAMPNIDGGLIGGASLQATDFIALIKACV